MIKTGVFGGSFNPIHKGHTALAHHIVKQGLVDELWFVVSPHNPLKKNNELMDDAFRLKMVQVATRNMKHVFASDIEFHLTRPSFMFHTLTNLTENHPDRLFSLIIGADNWLLFEKWYRWKDILNQWPIIVYPRKDCPIQEAELPPGVTFLNCPLYPISSTEIRQRLKNNQRIDEWMNKNVLKMLQDQ